VVDLSSASPATFVVRSAAEEPDEDSKTEASADRCPACDCRSSAEEPQDSIAADPARTLPASNGRSAAEFPEDSAAADPTSDSPASNGRSLSEFPEDEVAADPANPNRATDDKCPAADPQEATAEVPSPSLVTSGRCPLADLHEDATDGDAPDEDGETTHIHATLTFYMVPRHRHSRSRSSSAPPHVRARQLLAVALLLVAIAWGVVGLTLSLPLSVGRALVRYILATQAKRISDFLPLSLGVVVSSAAVLAVAKICEALPMVGARAAAVEHRRCGRLLVCAVSMFFTTAASLILVPVGLGTLLLKLALPLKAHSVYHVPIVFLVTDCWSLGLILTKVLCRMVQADVLFRHLHLDFVVISSRVEGSFTNLFFDLAAHRLIWRSLLLPVLERITIHLVFPQAAAQTLLLCCIPEDQEYWRAALLMYCYHVVLGVRLWFAAVPVVRQSLASVRQSIFDAKYLVSTELQNYQPSGGGQSRASEADTRH